MVNVKIPNNRLSIFMPVQADVTMLGKHSYMRELKRAFDRSSIILCYCHKCVKSFMVHNNYNELIRFTHALVTKLGKNIKNNEQRSLLLSHYSIISTKEGIISDMVKNNGQLSITCPACLYNHFMDYLEVMRELKKEVVMTNDNTMCLMTKELIESELILIDDIYKPLFMGYVTSEQLKSMAGL